MSDIKECFKSRFEDGLIVEADFSSLEVYVAALLSNDAVLIAELQKGLDPHLENAAVAFNKPKDQVTKEERTHAKGLTFLLFYGGGSEGMSLKHNLPVDFCENFINNFYNKYQDVKIWHESLLDEVKRSRKPSEKGPVGIYRSYSGRVYKFLCYDSEFKQGLHFAPTQIKNYPVQGGAFDIVSLGLVYLFKKLLPYREDIKLINCVHDSYLFDCKKESLPVLVQTLKLLEDNLTALVEKCYNIKSPLKFKLEIEAGPTWGQKQPIGESNG